MPSRRFRFPIIPGITLVLLGSLAMFFLGGASVSGGHLLEYPGDQRPSEERYAGDEQFLRAWLESAGFQSRAGTDLPPHVPRRPVPAGFRLVFPLKYTDPISLGIYGDAKRSGFWISTEARHPTWAVPLAKAALKKLGGPLNAAWANHLADPAAFPPDSPAGKPSNLGTE